MFPQCIMLYITFHCVNILGFLLQKYLLKFFKPQRPKLSLLRKEHFVDSGFFFFKFLIQNTFLKNKKLYHFPHFQILKHSHLLLFVENFSINKKVKKAENVLDAFCQFGVREKIL